MDATWGCYLMFVLGVGLGGGITFIVAATLFAE